MTQIQKKFGRRRMKWTMATIRSRIDHHEKAKSRNDPIWKSHYSMRALPFDPCTKNRRTKKPPDENPAQAKLGRGTLRLSIAAFSFCCRVVVVAHDAGDFPGPVFVLPQVNEFAFADPFGVFVAGMVEAVNAHFDRSVSLHIKDVQAAGNEFPRRLAANVFLDAVGQGCSAQGHAALVVIELDVFVNEGSELVEIAFVVGVKQRGIESGDRAVELLLVLNLVERRDGLGEGRADEQNR